MPDEPTQQPLPDSTAPDALPGEPDGVSTPTGELPDEYKPYSHIPWGDVPEDIRPGILDGVKTFHGDMTRDRQELLDQVKEVPGLRQKADTLEYLWNQPWFQDAYGKMQTPSSQPPEPATDTLSEHLDSDTAKAIKQAVQDAIKGAIDPVQQKMAGLEQQVTSREVESVMSKLRDKAKAQGWPSPDDKVGEIQSMLQAGEARTIEGAYERAIFSEVPKIAQQQAIEKYKAELQRKAETTLPPTTGPVGTPGMELFKGKDCVTNAVQAARKELLQRR